MLEQHALWFISVLLFIVELIVAIFVKNTIGSIIAMVLGFICYIVGVFAFKGEKEFIFEEHRRVLVAPFLGIFSSFTLFFATFLGSLDETKAIIGLVSFLVVTILSTVAVFKYSERLLQWIQRIFPKKQSIIIQTSPEQQPVPEGGWRCVCGRPHAAYVSSCICGVNKHDALTQHK